MLDNYGIGGAGKEHDDFLDEMLREITKKVSFEKNSSEKGLLLAHPDTHRLLKELVKEES